MLWLAELRDNSWQRRYSRNDVGVGLVAVHTGNIFVESIKSGLSSSSVFILCIITNACKMLTSNPSVPRKTTHVLDSTEFYAVLIVCSVERVK